LGGKGTQGFPGKKRRLSELAASVLVCGVFVEESIIANNSPLICFRVKEFSSERVEEVAMGERVR